jgi:hypothetical protein
VDDYWNHTSAYHSWLIDVAARHRGHVLDVGCGEGLLVQRLAGVSRSVVGVDFDPFSVWRACERLQLTANTSGVCGLRELATGELCGCDDLGSVRRWLILRCSSNSTKCAPCWAAHESCSAPTPSSHQRISHPIPMPSRHG